MERPYNKQSKKGIFNKRLMSVVTFLMVFLFVLNAASCAKKEDSSQKPVIGVAWRSDQNSESFAATCQAIEAAGGTARVLGLVRSYDLYYENDQLKDGKYEDGSLSKEAAKLVKTNTWRNSNVEEIMAGINVVVFPGGEDISPSLYFEPQDAQTKEGFSAERDVSDYLLMSYCLEKDIPVLAICRGMQMLSVVSGASVAQDIPAYFKELGLDYGYEHRNEPKIQGEYRDFAFHDVVVKDHDSLLYRLMGADVIKDAPSWHHQAVVSTEGTRLKVTGTVEISGLEMIEAVERPDKSFVLGVQYHPEIAVVRSLDNTSINYFRKMVELAKR